MQLVQAKPKTVRSATHKLAYAPWQSSVNMLIALLKQYLARVQFRLMAKLAHLALLVSTTI